MIVAPEAFDLWLDCANVDAATAAALMAPAPTHCSSVMKFRLPSIVWPTTTRLVEPLAATKFDTLAAAEPRSDKKRKGDDQPSLF